MNQKKWVVMIHDGAYDGRNIVSALKKQNFPIVHITRSRKFWDKTFNIGLKIIRAKGDLYHANVALQDAFMTLLIKKIIGKKPVIIHCHGTDLRTDLNKWEYRHLVKFNVKNADQIFVADLDTMEKAKELNPTAIWIPIPINLDIYYPKNHTPTNEDTFRIFYPNIITENIRGSLTFFKAFNIFAKEYDDVQLDAIKIGADLKFAMQLCKKAGTLNHHVKFRSLIPYEEIVDEYRNHDLTIGVFKSGIISTVGLESWAVQRPILNYIDSKLYPKFNYLSARTVDEIIEALYKLTDSKTRTTLAKAGYRYVTQYHDLQKVANKVKKVYLAMM
ncbi:MAG: hypothetical protein ACTSQI_09865 [Candidatus Helarchaeota archaeon]